MKWLNSQKESLNHHQTDNTEEIAVEEKIFRKANIVTSELEQWRHQFLRSYYFKI